MTLDEIIRSRDTSVLKNELERIVKIYTNNDNAALTLIFSIAGKLEDIAENKAYEKGKLAGKTEMLAKIDKSLNQLTKEII